MKIQSITSVHNFSSNQLQIFGLGEDNRVYAWSYQLGGWLLNDLATEQARIAKSKPFVTAEEGAKARASRTKSGQKRKK